MSLLICDSWTLKKIATYLSAYDCASFRATCRTIAEAISAPRMFCTYWFRCALTDPRITREEFSARLCAEYDRDKLRTYNMIYTLLKYEKVSDLLIDRLIECAYVSTEEFTTSAVSYDLCVQIAIREHFSEQSIQLVRVHCQVAHNIVGLCCECRKDANIVADKFRAIGNVMNSLSGNLSASDVALAIWRACDMSQYDKNYHIGYLRDIDRMNQVCREYCGFDIEPFITEYLPRLMNAYGLCIPIVSTMCSMMNLTYNNIRAYIDYVGSVVIPDKYTYETLETVWHEHYKWRFYAVLEQDSDPFIIDLSRDSPERQVSRTREFMQMIGRQKKGLIIFGLHLVSQPSPIRTLFRAYYMRHMSQTYADWIAHYVSCSPFAESGCLEEWMQDCERANVPAQTRAKMKIHGEDTYLRIENQIINDLCQRYISRASATFDELGSKHCSTGSNMTIVQSLITRPNAPNGAKYCQRMAQYIRDHPFSVLRYNLSAQQLCDELETAIQE